MSVAKVFHLDQMKHLVWLNEGNKAGKESANLFLKSIGLREYSRYLSFNYPCSHQWPLIAHPGSFLVRLMRITLNLGKEAKPVIPWLMLECENYGQLGWLYDRIVCL